MSLLHSLTIFDTHCHLISKRNFASASREATNEILQKEKIVRGPKEGKKMATPQAQEKYEKREGQEDQRGLEGHKEEITNERGGSQQLEKEIIQQQEKGRSLFCKRKQAQQAKFTVHPMTNIDTKEEQPLSGKRGEPTQTQEVEDGEEVRQCCKVEVSSIEKNCKPNLNSSLIHANIEQEQEEQLSNEKMGEPGNTNKEEKEIENEGRHVCKVMSSTSPPSFENCNESYLDKNFDSFDYFHCVMSVDANDWDNALKLQEKSANFHELQVDLNQEHLLEENKKTNDIISLSLNKHREKHDNAVNSRLIFSPVPVPVSAPSPSPSLSSPSSPIDNPQILEFTSSTSLCRYPSLHSNSEVVAVGIGIHPWKAHNYTVPNSTVGTNYGRGYKIESVTDSIIAEGTPTKEIITDNLLNPTDMEKAKEEKKSTADSTICIEDAHRNIALDSFLEPSDFERTSWLTKMETILQNNERVVVGEIGLDKQAKCPESGKVEFDNQKVLFEKQLEIAIKYNRPISIHCVKSYGAILSILQTAKTRFNYLPSTAFHSYTGSIEVTIQLMNLYENPQLKTRQKGIDLNLSAKFQQNDINFTVNDALPKSNVYFGFSSSVNLRTESMKRKSKIIIESLPLNKILIESDMFEVEEAQKGLCYFVHHLADWKGVDLKTAIQVTKANGIKWLTKR